MWFANFHFEGWCLGISSGVESEPGLDWRTLVRESFLLFHPTSLKFLVRTFFLLPFEHNSKCKLDCLAPLLAVTIILCWHQSPLNGSDLWGLKNRLFPALNHPLFSCPLPAKLQENDDDDGRHVGTILAVDLRYCNPSWFCYKAQMHFAKLIKMQLGAICSLGTLSASEIVWNLLF